MSNPTILESYFKLAESVYWRPVDEEPKPPTLRTVLLYVGPAPYMGERVVMGYRLNDVWVTQGGTVVPATHWQPLPDPPRTEEQIRTAIDSMEGRDDA